MRKIGYAAGGAVSTASSYGVQSDTGASQAALAPAIMSLGLHERSKNPDYTDDDTEANASEPAGAPSGPDTESYRKGGPVKRRTGYQEGGEVDDDEDEEEVEPTGDEEGGQEVEESDEDEDPEEKRQREVEAAENAQPYQTASLGDEAFQVPESAKTGYNAIPLDQADRDSVSLDAQAKAAQEPTGYHRQSQDYEPPGVLQSVLDWTRKMFGLGGEKAPTLGDPQGRPWYSQDTGELPINAATAAVKGIVNAATAPIEGEGEPSFAANYDKSSGRKDLDTPFKASQPREVPPTETTAPHGPLAGEEPRNFLERAVQNLANFRDANRRELGTAGGPAGSAGGAPVDVGRGGAQTALRDYINGARSFTPDQMSELLNRTSRDNPGIDMNGAISKTFNDLHAKGDMDGASRFLQALRPSYDNMRASAIAAISQGNVQGAMKLASQMDNLIPGGTNVNFMQGQDGKVVATVKNPDGRAQAFSMTPQQFAQFLNSPTSVFDIAAEMGSQDALRKAGAQEVRNMQTAGGQPMQAQIPQPMTAATQGAPGTGFSAGMQRSAMYPDINNQGQPTAPQGYVPPTPQQQAQMQAGYQRALRDHYLQMQAYNAFPNENQRGQRERMLERLRGQNDKLEAERYKQGELTARARERNALHETPQQRLDREAARSGQIRERVQQLEFQRWFDKQKAANPDWQPSPRQQRIYDAIESGLDPQSRQQPQGGAQPTAQPDTSTYQGDTPPYQAPAGQRWGRSKSTGQWSLRPAQ